MSANSSSSFNGSLHHPHQSSTGLFFRSVAPCYFSEPSSYTFTVFYIVTGLILLPLCILVLRHGFQKWWGKRSASSAAAMSHSEIFTYHLAAMELIGTCRCFLYCCGIYIEDATVIYVSNMVSCFTWLGEMFFHILTCVEHYLAVVQPITYISLRSEKGTRIRNVIIGCVWLLCFTAMSFFSAGIYFIYIYLFLLISSLSVTSFCSVSVLRVLIRPGPGGRGGDRERVDQSKQRAFYTIVAILGVLVARFAGSLMWGIFLIFEVSYKCLITACVVWLNVPSSLVLPLLFLYRERKSVRGKNSIQ